MTLPLPLPLLLRRRLLLAMSAPFSSRAADASLLGQSTHQQPRCLLDSLGTARMQQHQPCTMTQPPWLSFLPSVQYATTGSLKPYESA